MRSKAIIPLVVGLGVGLVALKLGVDAVRNAQGSQAAPVEIEVVVATVDIRPTMQITPDVVVVKKTPKTPLLPPDAFSRIEEVVNRVTSKTVTAGMPLSPAVLAPEGTTPGLSVKIPEGHRAVSVKIDEVTGVAFQLLPGSFVDVLVVMDVTRGRKKETMSRVILQNVQVAAVGQLLGDPHDESGAPTRAKSVTLLVRVEDVPKLHLAQTKGKVTLAMRGGEDELQTAGISEAFETGLLGGYDVEPGQAPPVAPLSSSPPRPTLGEEMFAQAPAHPPFTTVVINGPLGAGSSGQVMRVTYKDERSMEVVDVGKGRTPGDSASMEFGAGDAQREPRSRSLFTDRDRTLRRRGARGDVSGPEVDEETSYKETAE